MANCTAPPPDSISTSNTETLKVGSKPFKLDPQKINHLTIAKFDPTTGTQWIAVMHHEQKNWKFSSSPPDHPLLDPFANEIFIAHLLDTLQSLKINAPAPRGSLESLGLDPPQFAIRWTTENTDSEIRIGSPLRDGSGYYFTRDGVQSFVASGSVFKMLGLIDTFDFLRKRTWTLLAADEVDEIHLRGPGKKAIYAQREGSQWTDQEHHTVKKEIGIFLNTLVASQAEKFIDDPMEAKKLKNYVQSRPTYDVSLNDRFGNSTSFKIRTLGSLVYGINSSRPQAICSLNPKILKAFEKVQD